MANQHPRITVVIPSLRGDTRRLENALQSQTWPADELCVVRGVRPNGRARNQGAAGSSGEFLVFIDDDALPGSPDLIEQMVRPLIDDPTIGVTGAARVLPAGASWFQRRVAGEIPRTVNPVPQTPLETNPPLYHYGHTLITTTCCALPSQIYRQVKGFREDLTSGVDTDFFYRVRQLGYRFVMVPDVYVEHPAPESLRSLIRKFYWYGQGYGQETRQRPEQKMGVLLPTSIHRLFFLVAASLWLLPNVFILYSLGYPHFELGFRPLKALSTYAVAWGYASSWKDGEAIINEETRDRYKIKPR